MPGAPCRRSLTALGALALILLLALAGCAPTPALPGTAPRWMAQVAGRNQVIVVSGDSVTGTQNTVTLYDRTTTGWQQRGSWRGWNGRNGWAYAPRTGRSLSPVGVFTLTAAGGYAPNPATRLPYEYWPAHYALMVNGVRTFNRVVAIDSNRVPYSYPSDLRRPDGPGAAFGLWLHVSHNSATAGCVSVPDAAMLRIQQWLNPAARPVILMGPSSELRR